MSERTLSSTTYHLIRCLNASTMWQQAELCQIKNGCGTRTSIVQDEYAAVIKQRLFICNYFVGYEYITKLHGFII